MGKKISKQSKKTIVVIVRRPPEPEKTDRLKEFLSYVRVGMFFLLGMFVLYKYTNVFDYWGRFFNLTRDPVEEYVEQAERERLAIIAECELYKKDLSQEVRTDLFIATKFIHRIFKKYLSFEEYNHYAWLEYDSQFRIRTVDEVRFAWYYLEKVKKEMTPGEKEELSENMKVIDRVSIELKKIKSKQPEKVIAVR